jgi:hypothetical protein
MNVRWTRIRRIRDCFLVDLIEDVSERRFIHRFPKLDRVNTLGTAIYENLPEQDSTPYQ